MYVIYRFVPGFTDQDVLFTFPAESLDFDSTNLPDNVLNALDEAAKCFTSGCYVASAIMIRKTLEEICHDRNATGDNLKQRVTKLGSSIVVPQELLRGLDNLRLLGNDAAHVESQTFNQIGREEVEVSFEFTKEFLKAVYQYGSLIERIEALKTSSNPDHLSWCPGFRRPVADRAPFSGARWAPRVAYHGRTSTDGGAAASECRRSSGLTGVADTATGSTAPSQPTLRRRLVVPGGPMTAIRSEEANDSMPPTEVAANGFKHLAGAEVNVMTVPTLEGLFTGLGQVECSWNRSACRSSHLGLTRCTGWASASAPAIAAAAAGS